MWLVRRGRLYFGLERRSPIILLLRVDFKLTTLVYLSLSRIAAAYLAAGLSDGLRRRSSSAAFCHIKDVHCKANLQQLLRQVFCSCRPKLCNSLPVDL